MIQIQHIVYLNVTSKWKTNNNDKCKSRNKELKEHDQFTLPMLIQIYLYFAYVLCVSQLVIH